VVFRGAHVGVLHDELDAWPPHRALLRGFVYDTLADRRGGRRESAARRRWLRDLQGPYSPQPYQQLIGVMRASGRDADARRLGIANEWQSVRRGSLSVSARLGKLVLGATLGFGYLPWLALVWGLVIVFAGWRLAFDPTHFVRTEASPPHLGKLAYSFDAFLPVIDLHQEESWRPTGDAAYYLWFHIALGWLLTTLGVLGITGLVRRD
jgi:ribosomal protein L27